MIVVALPWAQRPKGGTVCVDLLETAGRHNAQGLVHLDRGRTSEAAAEFEAAVKIYASLDAAHEASQALHNLALALMRLGGLDRAQACIDAALDLAGAFAEDGGQPTSTDEASDCREAAMRITAGVLARKREEPDVAEAHYRRARRLYERHGREDDVLDVRLNLAALAQQSGNLREARQELEELRVRVGGADLSPTPKDGQGMKGLHPAARERLAAADTTLSAVAGQQGRLVEAAALLAEAEGIYRDLQLPRQLANVITNQAYVHLHAGDFTRARRLLLEAEDLFARMHMELDRARVLGGIAGLERRIGNYSGSAAAYHDALAIYRSAGLQLSIAETEVNIGVVRCAQEAWSEAISILQAARETASAAGVETLLAAAEHNLGLAHAGLRDWDQAREHYIRALAYYTRVGRPLQIAELQTNLGIVDAAGGELAAARERYAAARRQYRELGMWMQAARSMHNEGLTWPPASAERREMVVAAWLALEAARFTLREPSERLFWREEIGSPTAAAFDAADKAASPVLLVEMIERARAVGNLHLARPAAWETTGELPTAEPDDGDVLAAPWSDELDAQQSLPVSAAILVACTTSPKLRHYVRSAQRILDLRSEGADGTSEIGLQLSTQATMVTALLR